MQSWMVLMLLAAGDPQGQAAAIACGGSYDDDRQADAILRAAEASRERRRALDALAEVLPVPPPPPPTWSYTVGGRAESVGGNADAYNLGVDANVTGRFGAWGAQAKVGYAYGRTRQATVPVANNGQASLRAERDFTPLLSSYLLAGTLFDRVASIKGQGFGEGGMGFTFIEHRDGAFVLHHLQASVGFRVTYEARTSYYAAPLGPMSPPDHWIYAPTVGLGYRWALSRRVFVTEDALLAVDVRSKRDLRVNSDTALNVQLTDAVTAALTFKVRYIGQPAANRKTTDTTLAATLSYSF